MTAKQYLQTYQKLDRRYNALIEEIKSVESEMISLKSPRFEERVSSSPKNDPVGEMVCNLEKENTILTMKLLDCKARMLLIKNQIAELENVSNDYYIILLFRYILYKDWKFICNKLNISRAQANVIHGRALLEFDNKFGEEY